MPGKLLRPYKESLGGIFLTVGDLKKWLQGVPDDVAIVQQVGMPYYYTSIVTTVRFNDGLAVQSKTEYDAIAFQPPTK